LAQSDKEKALQARLDAANAALAAEKEDRAELLAQVANARAAAIAETAAMIVAQKNPAAVQANAAVLASSDAANAQVVAETNGASARKAAQDALLAEQSSTIGAAGAANTARAQNVALMITQAFGFLAVLTGLFWKGYTETRDRRWAREDTLAHQKEMLLGLGQAKDAAQAAYKEANTVNVKIASIGMQMKDGTPADAIEAKTEPKSMWGAGGGGGAR
jgi:hypothetical protein